MPFSTKIRSSYSKSYKIEYKATIKTAKDLSHLTSAGRRISHTQRKLRFVVVLSEQTLLGRFWRTSSFAACTVSLTDASRVVHRSHDVPLTSMPTRDDRESRAGVPVVIPGLIVDRSSP